MDRKKAYQDISASQTDRAGEEEFSEAKLSSFVVFDEEEPRVLLRSPADCSSIGPRSVAKT